MITRFHVENYKALKDVTLELTTIHVLIGPNDSGKTSILEAVGALSRSADHPLEAAFTGDWRGRDLVWQGADALVSLEAQFDSWKYCFGCTFLEGSSRSVWLRFEHAEQRNSVEPAVHLDQPTRYATTVIQRFISGENRPTGSEGSASVAIRDAIRGVEFYKWVPEHLSRPAALNTALRFAMEPTGFGLPQVLDGIQSGDWEQATRLQNRFRSLFRQIRSFRLQHEPAYRVRT